MYDGQAWAAPLDQLHSSSHAQQELLDFLAL